MNLKLQMDRELPIIEIINDEGEVFSALSRNDAGVLETCFHPALARCVLPYGQVIELIDKAKARMHEEEALERGFHQS